MTILSAYARLRSVQIAALIYFLIALVLTQIPLFNYLGYEFSAVMTIPAAVISGILTIGFLRDHLTKPLTRRTYLYVLFDYYTVNTLLLGIPLITILLNAFVVKNCSLVNGLIFFALLPLCTMFFSVSAALVTTLLFRHARTVYFLFVVLLLSHIIFITYTSPQLFAYNFILGYFPGITYDEIVGNLPTLLLYREFTVIAGLLCIALFFILVGSYRQDLSLRENYKRIRVLRYGERLLWGVVALCCVILAAGHFSAAALEFQYTARDIQSGIGRRTESDHFIIYYPSQKLSGRVLQVLKAEAEFHYWTVVERLREQVAKDEKISVYLYPDAEAKRRYIGTATTNIAKPWRKEIHITIDSFSSTFRHELVHVMVAAHGVPIVNASLLLALNEGLAMAIDSQDDFCSPHEYCAALLRDHSLSPVEELFRPAGFAVQNSTYAYTVAGSFAKYLIDRFGIGPFKKVFATGNFVRVYGESIETLLKDWKSFLSGIDCSMVPPVTVKIVFFQQSIFQKTCARTTAERNNNAVRALRAKNYSEAEREFASSFDEVPTSFALRGLFQSYLFQHNAGAVVRRFQKLPSSSSLRYQPALLLFAGDAYTMMNDVPQAGRCYHQILDMNISPSYNSAAAVRLRVLDDTTISSIVGLYYWGSQSDSVRTLFLERLTVAPALMKKKYSPVIKYLLAQEYYRSGRYADAGKLFGGIISALPDRALSSVCARLAADAWYRSSSYEEAKGAFWQAKNYTGSATQDQWIDEQIELCNFVSTEIQ